MRKIFLSLALSTGLLAAGAAHASRHAETCTLRFAVHIDTVVLLSHGYGNAVVWCNGADGKIVSKRNMSVEIEGIGPGLGVFDLEGTAEDLDISSPRQLRGTYTVNEGNVGTIGVWGTPYEFHGHNKGLSFVGGLTAASGIGAQLNSSRWTFR